MFEIKKIKIITKRIKFKRVTLVSVILLLSLLLLTYQEVLAVPSATLWITHTNNNPTLGNTDTIQGNVEWSEMMGKDAYSVSLIFPTWTYADFIDKYDTPTIYYDTSTSSKIYDWFHGYISDTGHDYRHWVEVKYKQSGTFIVTMVFRVYCYYYVFGYRIKVETGKWETTSSWNVGRYTGLAISQQNEYENNTYFSNQKAETRKLKSLYDEYSIYELMNFVSYTNKLDKVKAFLQNENNVSIWLESTSYPSVIHVIYLNKPKGMYIVVYLNTKTLETHVTLNT